MQLWFSKNIMEFEESFGIIPIKKQKDKIFVYLVYHQKGHWGFPKGHAEKEETSIQAATRELLEETGLRVNFVYPDLTFSENYIFTFHERKIQKHVLYFVANVRGKEKVDPKEILKGKWVERSEAKELATFPETKNLCQQIENLPLSVFHY